ncbi:MAG: tetratricopeptide repeat protein [Polyangiaceae bacterium]
MKRFGLAAVVATFAASLLASTLSTDAGAQQSVETHDTFGTPNVWDIAKKPAIREDFVVHVLARRLLFQADQILHPDMLVSTGEKGQADNLLSRASLLLSEAIRAGSTDPRLRFDLGEVQYLQKDYRGTYDTLQKALRDFPNGDGAHAAWLTYAFACSMLDRPDEEGAAYDKFLRDEVTPQRRAVPLLNLAEANMRGHRLREAVEGYREVEQLSAMLANGSSETGVLAVWGLAIALDREGDFRGAAEQARIVSRMDPETPISNRRMVLDGPGVYFVPAYERFWYQALATTEDAKQASSATLAAKEWGRVVVLWKAYLEPAEQIAHPEEWNSVAKTHLVYAEKQLKSAVDRVKREPAPKKTDVRVFDF